jgi:O-antigen/teichoic acid export membrane protein
MLRMGQAIQELFGKGVGDHSQRRTNLLRLAVMSNGLSKLSAIGLQGLAIPLVFRALGTHNFALYLLLTAALATLALLQFGVGPGLTQAVAKAHALGDHDEERSAFVSSFLFVGSSSALGAMALLSLVRAVPPGTLFGPSFAGDRAEIIQAADVVVLVMFLFMLASVVDSLLAGYQAQVATNLGTCAANIASTAGLLALCYRFHPSILQVVLVMYGGAILSRLVNLLLLFARRPYLVRGPVRFNSHNFGLMMRIGLAFWVVQGASVLEQHGGTYLVAHVSDAHNTDIFGVVYRATCLGTASVGILTQPLWPAFTDAVARRDSKWLRKAIDGVRRVVISVALVLAFVMVTMGVWGIEHIWRIDLTGNRWAVYIFGVYLFTNLWTHFHYVVLMGLDRVWTVAGVILVENLVMLALGFFTVSHFGAVGMAGAYLLANICLPALVLPQILSKRISTITRHVAGPSPVNLHSDELNVAKEAL